jgi:small subunit ribosomal protein S16
LLVIRLARTGRAKYPTYRIVAAESARAATGKFVAVLGHYNPHTKELVIKREEVQKHLGNGAQPSNTVVKLLQREKVELPAWVKLKTKEPKKVDAPAAEAAETEEVTADEAAADAGEEAPAIANEDERVAEVAEEAASENVTPDADATETAESEEGKA